MTDTPCRDSFAARFGDDQADRIEHAAMDRFFAENAILQERGVPAPHVDDDFGTESFRYWFLFAIATRIVTSPRKRRYYGITTDIEAMQEWARDPDAGDLISHDGDNPDYLAAMAGVFADWVAPRPGRPGGHRMGVIF